MTNLKNILKKGSLKISVGVVACVVSFAVAACVYIDSYNLFQVREGKEVLYAYAGEDVLFTLNGHIECHENHSSVNFAVAILVPKDWDVANTAVVTYKNDLADDRDKEYSMSLIPASQLPKNGGGRTWVECLTQEYGVGNNVLDDMEWVVFQTDQKWDIANNQDPKYTILFHLKAGKKNLKFHPGFFVNHTDDGFSDSDDHKKVRFADECFEVVGGVGAVMDFCNNHYNKVNPMMALQDDYVTFTFNGDVANNELNAFGGAYFVGEAVTVDGKVYKAAPAVMTRENSVSNVYNITLWPTGFFNVPEGEVIQYINYYFASKDGTVTITQSDDDFEQLGTPMPAEKQPFTFNLTCD